jgi:SAM-dependent methyltransferase
MIEVTSMSLPTNCRLCGAGPDAQEVVTRHVYGGTGHQAFFHCSRCDVNYQFPPIPEEDEKRLYQSEFERFMQGRAGANVHWDDPEKHVASNRDQQRRRFKYLSKYLEGNRRDVCEIGCSSGFMLYPLRDEGHRVFGVEPSGIFGEFLERRGIDHTADVAGLFEGGSPKRQFDVVMHFFVLEHVRDPFSFLEMNLKLVRPGGVLVAEIPNAADPLHTVYAIPAFERFYWSLPHHWYFTETSMRYVVDRLGVTYEIVLDQRYDLSNHMTWALTGRPGGMGRYTEQLGTEIEDAYRKVLVARGLCDTLVAVIQKS